MFDLVAPQRQMQFLIAIFILMLFRMKQFVCNSSCEETFQTCFKCGLRRKYCSRTPCRLHPFSKHPKKKFREEFAKSGKFWNWSQRMLFFCACVFCLTSGDLKYDFEFLGSAKGVSTEGGEGSKTILERIWESFLGAFTLVEPS